ncbi:hypothetical protein COCC4DRAFT_30758, partial [Bipolaris maydis ATCC 48331]
MRIDGADAGGLPKREIQEYQDFPAHEDAQSESPLPFVDGLYVPDCRGAKSRTVPGPI